MKSSSTCQFAFQLRSYLHGMQRAVTDPAGLHDVRTEVVGHRPDVAVDFETIAGGQRVDAAEFEDAFRAVGKCAEDR